MVFDSHVLFEPEAFDYLLKTINEGGHERDILSGPLVGADGKSVSTHYEWKWRGQMLGIWGTRALPVERDDPPFEIEGTGTGVFCVNKKYFPGFHPAFRGFGAEELYIHEKVRRNGGVALCVPGLRWHHRFHRPSGTPYPNILWDRIRNYVIGFQELGLPIKEIHDYFVYGGFMSQKEWDFLVQDPIKHERPPIIFPVAEDAPEAKNILGHLAGKQPGVEEVRNPVPAPYRELVKNGEYSVEKAFEDNIKKQIASMPDSEIEKIPVPEQVMVEVNKLPEQERPKALRAYREGFLFSKWKEAVKGGPSPGPHGQRSCCGGKGEVQRPEFREAVVKQLQAIPTIQELKDAEIQTEVDPFYKDIILHYLSGAKKILEIGDDPIGGTAFIAENMDDDAILISLYEDQKFMPELDQIGRLATEGGRAVKLSIGGIDTLDIRDDTFDLVFLNPTMVDSEYTYKLLQKVLPHVNGRVLYHKTDKYWIRTADGRPGIIGGLAKYLNEEGNQKWSVVKMYKEGLGLAVLSNLPEDKPKLPSTAKMAANFTKAVAKHIATGAREVSKAELEYRLTQCSVCEHRVDNRCSLCGCFITSNVLSKGKAFWKDQHCPIGKWQGFEEDK